MPSDDCNDAEIAALMADDSCLSAATPARTPVNAGVPSETPKRRRGRPCANPIGEAASWTAEMIEILLEQKTTFARASADARNNDAVQLGWNRLALSVNTILHANFSSKQIKDKYANLATLYRKIKEAENETGNKTPKKKPLYWEPLNSHFSVDVRVPRTLICWTTTGSLPKNPHAMKKVLLLKGMSRPRRNGRQSLPIA